MEHNNAIIIALTVITIIAIISSIIFASRVADLKALLAEEERLKEKASDAHNLAATKVRSLEKDLSEIVDKKTIVEKELQLAQIKIGALQSKADVLFNENKKLLEAAADDVTINLKAGDDAKVIAENPKPRRKFHKKKSAGPKKG